MKILFWPALFLLSNCSSVDKYYRQPLVKQTLRPRVGYNGLTHRACEKWGKEECEEYVVINYDLNDEKVRKQLHDFKFICSVNGNRYYICADEPALCRNSFSGFFGKKKHITKIQITEIDYLVNGATECSAQ